MDGHALGVERRADIHHAIHQLLRTAREIIFFANAVRLQARLEMFRKIFAAAGHPAGGLDRLRGDIMIRIFLVMVPGIVAEYRVDLQQPEQKDQAHAQLDPADIIHAMVAVAQIENVFQARRLDQCACVALVG